MRVEAQDFTPTPEGMYAETSALYQSLREAKGKYSTVTIMRYASNALDLRYLVSVVLDPGSPDTIFTSEENVNIGGMIGDMVIDGALSEKIMFYVQFPTLNQNFDVGSYNFTFMFDAQNNIIKPLSHKYWNKDLTPSEFLLGVEEVLQKEIQSDFDDNTDPKVKEILLEKDSNFVNDCGIVPMTKEVTRWWVQNLYYTLRLQKPTGVQISLWETLFSGFEFEKEPQYIKTALWNILKEDMERYLPGIISGVLKDNPTIIDIGNPLISFKAIIKDVLEPLASTEYVFDETNYNRTVLHKRIPDEFKPKESKYYIHIMNEVVKDPVRYVKEFMQLTGEVAASDLVDEFYKTHKNTLAVVLYGLANAEFPHDVYSYINEETGLRELGQQRGEERTEAWIIPANATLIGVITDIPGFQEKLQEAKIPLYDVDITSLQPEKTEGVWWDYSDKINELHAREQELLWDIQRTRDDLSYAKAHMGPPYGGTEGVFVLEKQLEQYNIALQNIREELSVLKDNPQEYQQMEDISKQFGLEFYGKKRVCTNIRVCSYDQTVDTIKEMISQRDDLRRPKYRGNPNPYAGHCYIASEALYYLLGGKEAGWHPMFIRHEDEPHWFLKNDNGDIIDPTAEQFETPVPYEEAVGKGFLTNYPSARAQQLLDEMTGA
jgi:hypothetical protein